jgi:hypothetical protein
MNRVEIKLLERGERTRRRALNSPLGHGSGETVKYFVDFRPWGASTTYPCSSPVITILDENDDDVTATLCAGGGSVVSSYEVEFTVTSVSAQKRYRCFVKATINSLVGECWTYIDGEL